jgi:hypothetical protein
MPSAPEGRTETTPRMDELRHDADVGTIGRLITPRPPGRRIVPGARSHGFHPWLSS